MTAGRQILVLVAAALAWFAYAVAAGQPDMAPPLVTAIARTAAYVLSAVVTVRLLGILVVGALTGGRVGLHSTALLRLVVYLVLGLAATALVMNYGLHVNVTTVLTTSALLTAILGLAMQSTLASLFAGLAIQLEHHLRPGDAIFIDGAFAKVEAMGWRSITLRRLDRAVMMLPNAALAAREITIRRPGEPALTDLMIPAPLAVPPALAAEIIEQAVADIPGLCTDLPISAQMWTVNAQAGLADYRLRFFIRGENPHAATARMRAWYGFQRHGVTGLYPQPETGAPITEGFGLAPPERMRAALSASRRWSAAAAAPAGTPLLYAPGEPIRLPRGLEHAAALVVSGEIRLHGAAPGDWLEPPTAALDSGPMRVRDNEALLVVEGRMGRAIGPYGRLAARRAARTADSPAALHRALAPLIMDEAERTAFLAAAPAETVSDFGPGTVLRLASAPYGRKLIAKGRVELLAIPAG